VKLLLEVNCDVSNQPHFISHAVVELTPKLAKVYLQLLREYQALVKKHNNLWEIRFWDYAPLWLEGFDGTNDGDEAETFDPEAHLPDKQQAMLRDNQQVIVPDGFDMRERFAVARSECDQLVVLDMGVRWTCIAKHTDLYYSTETITWEQIKTAARGRSATSARKTPRTPRATTRSSRARPA
jgi:hypothetical protein